MKLMRTNWNTQEKQLPTLMAGVASARSQCPSPWSTICTDPGLREGKEENSVGEGRAES
jgi:hypothetical protein